MTRFKVTSVSGWSIRQGTHGASSRRETRPAWQVLDTVNCHHLIREFQPGWANTHRGVSLELEARTFAAELEEEYP